MTVRSSVSRAFTLIESLVTVAAIGTFIAPLQTVLDAAGETDKRWDRRDSLPPREDNRADGLETRYRRGTAPDGEGRVGPPAAGYDRRVDGRLDGTSPPALAGVLP